MTSRPFRCKTLALAGLGTLICLTLGVSAFATSEKSVEPDAVKADTVETQNEETQTVETASAIIKWDKSAQAMTHIEGKQAAVLVEEIRQQLNDRLLAAGRLAPTEEQAVEILPSGIKKVKTTADMMNFAVVRVGADGKLLQSCSNDATEAQDAGQTPVSAELAKGEQ